MAYYSGGASHFEHQDWLGTERLRTTYNGGVEGSYQSLPFGDGQATAGADGDANHYATLDHDTATNSDYAQYRQYANMQGRWLSPDPYSGSYKKRNPQSFNRYVYAGNNPLATVDPSGQDDCDLGSMANGLCDSSSEQLGLGGSGSDGTDVTGGNSSNDNTSSDDNSSAPTQISVDEIMAEAIAASNAYQASMGATLDTLLETEDLSDEVSDPTATATANQMNGMEDFSVFGSNNNNGNSNNSTATNSQMQMQQQQQTLAHGCTVVSGLLLVGDAAILFSGQEYLAPAALSLSFHVWAVCGWATW